MLLVRFLAAIAAQTYWVLYEGAAFILLGFAVAGVVHVLLDPERIVRHLGGRTLRAAFVAAVLGAPIPLCSCGVLPTAVSLRRKGASREATLSFLITTPETGVDSVAMTFAYFGPLMAIVRPLAAVATGLVAALASLRQSPDAGEPDLPPGVDVEGGHHHAEAEAPPPETLAAATFRERLRARARLAARYAFVDLFDELGFWLALAIVLTGALAALLPPDFFLRLFPSSFAVMVAMVLLGAPLYVCASASTPLAAVLVTKGASAGAALVFLLVGPATNAATIATVARLFGRAFVRTYLGAIIGVAIASGLLLDLLFPNLGQAVYIGQPAGVDAFVVPKVLGAIALGVLLVASLLRTGLRPGIDELAGNVRAAAAWARELRPRTIFTARSVQALVLLWLLSVVAGGFWRVPVGQRALVQRLGRVAGEPRAPGLAFAVPLVDRIDLVEVDAVRARPVGYRTVAGSLDRESVPEDSLYMTADENVIDLHAEVQYRATDPQRYRLGVEKPDELLAALVRARLVEAMTRRPIDLVYTNDRAEVQDWLLTRVQGDTTSVGLGIDILALRLLDVHAPAQVHDAFRDVASAHEDRLTTIHLANEYAAGIVAVARGEAERVVSDAQARAFERLARAQGDASAFLALSTEHKRAPRLTEDRLYLETAERTLAGARKIVRAPAGSSKGYELWVRGDDAPRVFPPAPGAPPPVASPPSPPPAPAPPPAESPR
jgi:hypothetical protein